jgi:hypothetical protein
MRSPAGLSRKAERTRAGDFRSSKRRSPGSAVVFFKSANDHKKLREWYSKNLGLRLEAWGGAILKWTEDKSEAMGSRSSLERGVRRRSRLIGLPGAYESHSCFRPRAADRSQIVRKRGGGHRVALPLIPDADGGRIAGVAYQRAQRRSPTKCTSPARLISSSVRRIEATESDGSSWRSSDIGAAASPAARR